MKETNMHSKTITHKTWNQVDCRFDYSFDFVFRTKNEYLEFRRSWKHNYAALSQSIRGLKASIRAMMRRREYAGNQQSERHKLKSEATLQLLMRRSAKQEASRQYLAARQSVS